MEQGENEATVAAEYLQVEGETAIPEPGSVTTGGMRVDRMHATSGEAANQPGSVTTATANSAEEIGYRPMTQAELNARVAAANPPVVAQRRTKAAILGFTDTWKLAPFDDPTFEIWGLNELYMFIPRWDRWFELHSRAVYEADKKRTDEHIPRLRAMTCPVYMHQHWDDIPASVPYPLQQIAQLFPNACPAAKPYLTNSITYMILLAIMEGFEEIHVYGVDMAHATEYGQQRPSCEWAVGIAQGRGIRVYIPPQADLLKTNFLYGYEQEQALAFDSKLESRIQDLTRKLQDLDNQMAQLNEVRGQHRGALQDAQHIRDNWRSLHTK